MAGDPIDDQLYRIAMSKPGTAFEKLHHLSEMKLAKAIEWAEYRGTPTVWAETVAQYLSDKWVEKTPVAQIANVIYWNWKRQEGI